MLAISLVILKITGDSWRLVSTTDPGVMANGENRRHLVGDQAADNAEA